MSNLTYTMRKYDVGLWVLFGHQDRRGGKMPWILAEVKQRSGRYYTTRVGIENGRYDYNKDTVTYYGASFEEAVHAAIVAASQFKA